MQPFCQSITRGHIKAKIYSSELTTSTRWGWFPCNVWSLTRSGIRADKAFRHKNAEAHFVFRQTVSCWLEWWTRRQGTERWWRNQKPLWEKDEILSVAHVLNSRINLQGLAADKEKPLNAWQERRPWPRLHKETLLSGFRTGITPGWKIM